MAWEWVAPVAAGGGASIGAITTLLTARGGRAHAERLAQLNAVHAERMARDERRQQRYAEAYIELLQLIERMGHWSQLVRPALDNDPPRELPAELPPLTEQAKVQALARAYGTSIVNKLVSEYHQAVRDIIRSDYLLTLAEMARKRGEESGIKPLQVWHDLDKIHRPAEKSKREEIAEQITAELQRN